MQSYPLSEIRDRQHEVFEQASLEPVLLTEESQPSYVVLSVQNYQLLLDRLAILEDQALGKLAETALKESQMVGSEIFTETLKQLAMIE